MKRIISPLLLLVLCFSLVSCGAEKNDTPPTTTTGSSYQTIAPADVKALLDDGTAFTLLDVRRADEYAAGHIPGAENLPNEEIADTRPDSLPNLDATIVVYCRTGVRSREAANKLLALGYTDVRDMGGIQSWPYDTVKG